MKSFIVKLVSFCILIFIVNLIIGNVISNKRANIGYYPAIRWNEFYEQKENSIDVIFLGSSHCYRSIVPRIIDSLMNVNSFNMGSSGQSPIVSFYVLKEVLKHQKPKKVFFEIYDGTISLPKNYLIASHNIDFIKSIGIKSALTLKTASFSDIPNILFPTYKHNSLKSLIVKGKEKGKEVDKNTNSYYDKKGYVGTKTYPTQKISFERRTINKEDFNTDQIKALQEIIAICIKDDIEIILFTQAYQPSYLHSIDNYPVYSNYIKDITHKQKIKYLDFNAPEYNHYFSDDDFYDHGHLFDKGAEKFSVLFSNSLQ